MKDKEPTKQHCIIRTSEKGTPFVGICILCNKSGLTTASDMNCPNPNKLSRTDALKLALGERQ